MGLIGRVGLVGRVGSTLMKTSILVTFVCALTIPALGRQSQPIAVDASRFGAIDRVVEEAIAAKQTPGAVVLVGRGDTVLFEKAYGRRAIVPSEEAMTLDTIFDLASLTKVVA